jgi:anaerobic selenocysteine-containing dehydrogenase
LDARAWPERRERAMQCIPTICFNCESACGLLTFVDRHSGEIVRFEGNPVHPGSRGRTCAKGPATLNQVRDPERILQPLKRVGPRGSGQFEPVRWQDAIQDIGNRIRTAFDAGRQNGVMYHVGRPGDDHFIPRMLQAWGIDGHNSHTNVCSASARLGYALWMGADRPSPDYSDTRFILLLSAHLETGHYFNPHAQRIIAAKQTGARIAVVDTRLSNTSTHADLWISPWPGSEAALLLGVARELLASGRWDRDFVREWVNWQEFLAAHDPQGPRTFDRFAEVLLATYDEFKPEFLAKECRVPADTVHQLADEIAAAAGRFASHLWRNTASGNLGGWQVARALVLLHALTGSIGRPGGVNPNSWDKFVPKPSMNPPALHRWNELIWPREYPLSHYEMSFLLPHLLRHQKARLDVYFTRVYNPVWTNPDGCSWIEMLEDEERVGCHVALTPIWSETAQWADYVLPTGLAPERHDVMSQETHAGTWIGFRQPVERERRRRNGERPTTTLGCNPGEVWEEAEFWIALTREIDPDGSRGIFQYFESKENPGQPVSLDEYFADLFDHAVPGLPEAAQQEGMTPLEYMRRFGAFDVPYAGQERYAQPVADDEPGVVDQAGVRRQGFKTPSGKLELHSPTLVDWGFGENALPGYIRSHVHWRNLDEEEMTLLPTFLAAGDFTYESAVGASTRCRAHRLRHGRPRARRNAHRLLRAACLGDGGNPPGRRGLLAPRGAMALAPRGGRRTAVHVLRADGSPQRHLPLSSKGRRRTFQERRPRHLPHLVARGRREPEPDLSGAARSRERHALLASGRARHARATRRPLRRHFRGHEQVAPSLPGVVRHDAPRARSRRLAPAAMAQPSPSPGARGVPASGVKGLARILWCGYRRASVRTARHGVVLLEVVVDAGTVRLDLRRFLEVGCRAFTLAQLHVGQAETVVGAGAVGQ